MVFFSLQIIKIIAQNVSPVLPYKVGYSSSFEMTNNKYSAVIMNIWKEFGNNSFSNFPGYFADTVQLQKLTGEYKGVEIISLVYYQQVEEGIRLSIRKLMQSFHLEVRIKNLIG